MFVSADERDTESLGPEAAGTTDAVEVRVSVSGRVIVDSDVDTFNVDTAAKDIGGDADALVAVFEVSVTPDSGS